jgi:hypothetical protein
MTLCHGQHASIAPSPIGLGSFIANMTQRLDVHFLDQLSDLEVYRLSSSWA